MIAKKNAALLALSAALLTGGAFAHAQQTSTTQNNGRTTAGTDDAGLVTGDNAGNAVGSGTPGMKMPMDSGMKMGMGTRNSIGTAARSKNAAMLIQTLSEEKTEISTLTAQQAKFKAMGGRENLRLAALWGRWIREHKAAGPSLMKLIKQNGGDPMQAKVLKAPALGTQQQMLDATHKDHEAAVMTSQMRHGMTSSSAIMAAMHKRGNLARKHIRQMAPYHDKHDMMKMDKMSVQG